MITCSDVIGSSILGSTVTSSFCSFCNSAILSNISSLLTLTSFGSSTFLVSCSSLFILTIFNFSSSSFSLPLICSSTILINSSVTSSFQLFNITLLVLLYSDIILFFKLLSQFIILQLFSRSQRLIKIILKLIMIFHRLLVILRFMLWNIYL